MAIDIHRPESKVCSFLETLHKVRRKADAWLYRGTGSSPILSIVFVRSCVVIWQLAESKRPHCRISPARPSSFLRELSRFCVAWLEGSEVGRVTRMLFILRPWVTQSLMNELKEN